MSSSINLLIRSSRHHYCRHSASSGRHCAVARVSWESRAAVWFSENWCGEKGNYTNATAGHLVSNLISDTPCVTPLAVLARINVFRLRYFLRHVFATSKLPASAIQIRYHTGRRKLAGTIFRAPRPSPQRCGRMLRNSTPNVSSTHTSMVLTMHTSNGRRISNSLFDRAWAEGAVLPVEHSVEVCSVLLVVLWRSYAVLCIVW